MAKPQDTQDETKDRLAARLGKDPEAALAVLRQSLRSAPERTENWRLLTQILMELDRPQDAAYAIAEWRRYAPDPAIALTEARLRLKLRDFERAQTLALSLPLAHPQHLMGLMLAFHCDLIASANRKADPALLDRIEAQLVLVGAWSQDHTEYLRRLRSARQYARAADFLTRLISQFGASPQLCFELGVVAFLGGNAPSARQLFDMVRGMDVVAKTLGAPDGPPWPEDATRAAQITARIAKVVNEPPPPALARQSSVPSNLPAHHANKRVLFVGPESLGNDPSYIENDVLLHMVGSGRSLGLSIAPWADDAIVYPSYSTATAEQSQQRLDALLRHIQETQCDLVLLDACYKPDSCTLGPDFLRRLKAETHARTALFLRDPIEEVTQCWQDDADALILLDPMISWLQTEPGREKGMLLPLPVDPTQFAPRQPEEKRDIDLLFIGAAVHPVRVMLLSYLQSAELPLTCLTHDRRRDLAPTIDVYAAHHRRARMVMNISQHAALAHLITGRVWETLEAGALLLEQDNPNIERFLTPYVHYMPWTDLRDLSDKVRYFQTHEKERAEIAANGHAFARAHYGARRFWGDLLERLFPEEK